MIDPKEFRYGNFLLQKINTRIVTVACNWQHFEMMSKGDLKDLFPLVLKMEMLEGCGFVENKEYPLLPDAREFILVMPVNGNNKNEVRIYIKNNKECFGRMMINDLPASNNFYHLHRLQNLYYEVTGEALQVRL